MKRTVLAAACGLILSLSEGMAQDAAPRPDRNLQPPSVIDPDLGIEDLKRSLTGFKVTSRPIEERFHIGSTPFSEIESVWNERSIAPYKSAMDAFSTAEGCLDSSAGGERKVDWTIVRTPAALEVCLFLIAEELGTPDDMAEWLRHIGLNSRRNPNTLFRWSEFALLVEASERLDIQKRPALHLYQFSPARLFGASVSVGIRYNNSGDPVSANVTVNTL